MDMNKPIIVVAVLLLVAGLYLVVYSESYEVPNPHYSPAGRDPTFGTWHSAIGEPTMNVEIYPYRIVGGIVTLIGMVTGLIGGYMPEYRYYTEIEPTEKPTET